MSDPVIPDPGAWVELESSNIARVQWVRTAEIDSFLSSGGPIVVGHLYVEFIGGGCGYYADVGEGTYGELLEADSAGTYLNTVVKPYYPYTKVR